MNKNIYKTIRKAFYIFSRNSFLYRIAQRYVYDHKAQNNCDIDTNGELDFLHKYLPDRGVVFDVGANVGEWAELVMASRPNVKIHCFEPSVGTFRILASNKFISKARCNNIGLGSVREEKKFYVFGDGSTVNSMYLRDGMIPLREDSVSIDTIDNYCIKNDIKSIDFLKIDVEGNELEVLKGASKMFQSAAIKIAQFEYGGTYIDSRIFLKDIFNYFNGLSYRIYKIYPGYVQYISSYGSDLEDFQYANYVAIQCDYENENHNDIRV